MCKYLFLPLLLFTGIAVAQNKGGMKGKIVDSINHSPIEVVTVAVLNARDTTVSAMITYAQTDKDGLFALRSLPVAIPLKVVISFVGYKPLTKFLTLIKGQTLDMGIVMLSPRQLNEVIITADRMPIIIKKDTIEFDAAAFKVRPNAAVEDLLKKLPGVEVDNDGKITAMGKDVTKIMIDGKEFFASDPRIASKNLDAELIDKVQVYDDREDDPNHLIPDVNVKKIINLKFKKALKKSVFGKVYAGQGTNNHYQTGGLFNFFRDTLQVSLLGVTNNLNSTGFDYQDLSGNGGLNRGGEAFARAGFGGGTNAPLGKQTYTAGGININTDYGKKLKINLAYLLNHTNTAFNSVTSRQQFLNDTTVTTNSTSARDNGLYKNALSTTVFWKPNDTTQLKYTPILNISPSTSSSGYNGSSFTNFVNPINNSVHNNSSAGKTLQFQQSLNYNHQFKKDGASLTIDHSLQINPGNTQTFLNQNLTSYLITFPSYSFRQLDDSETKNSTAAVSAQYRYPLSEKFIPDVTVSADYGNSKDRGFVYDYNPLTGNYDAFLLSKSNDLDRRQWAGEINPGFTYNVTKTGVLMGHMNAKWQQVDNNFNRNVPNINRAYFFMLPALSFSLKNIYISYNRTVQLPNIGDLVPYTVVNSPSSSVSGNPDLKPTRRDNFYISYRKSNYQKGIFYFINAGANFTKNGIFRQRTVDAQLVQTSSPINKDGQQSYFFSMYLNKRFKKKKDLQFSLTTSTSAFDSQNFFVLNHQEGLQHTYNINFNQRASLNWKDIVLFDPSYTLTAINTSYSNVNYNNKNYILHGVDAHVNIFWPKHINLEGKYGYNYNPLVPDGFQKHTNLLTLGLARQFLKKDRGEIKLSCYDILNQNISITRNINENTIADMQSQIIKRYFMLTLQFKFNKATTAR